MLRTPGTVATASAQFPLTPALSPEERENYRLRGDKSRHTASSRDERQSTLSDGERVRPNPTLAYRAHPQVRSAASVAPSPLGRGQG